ncbi:MAG: N-acetylmuramoyl-L-alanine amidase [Chloroflexi bacterium]|nr:MAG: N-acetylmuramoyl-L-alanine amidase [Chloroflexota bacterium]
MAGPIAKARHVQTRSRRRRGSSPLFRTALVLALALTSGLALVAGRSSMVLNGAQGSAPAATQVPVSGLVAGACMSFAPVAGRLDKTVFIDPGHGGVDPGVVGMAGGTQVLEKDLTLAVGTRLASMLRTDGYRVVMSRVADSSVARQSAADVVAGAMTASAVHRDLLARAACANAASASVLLSIHFDAFDDPSVGGSETFYDSARSFAPASKRLATDVQAAVVTALGNSDRGVWTDDQLAAPTLTSSGSSYGHLIELGPAAAGWVDNPSKMPGALVEPLFLTNPEEARYAASAAGQDRIAGALRTGLEKYLSGA